MYRHQGYNYVGIPAFKDYAHIKAHYESVAPIRGRSEECRPIGRRRYDWYEIVSEQSSIEEDGNPLGIGVTTYACKVYRTKCVEWYPNEDIVVRVPRWRGPTSMGMLTYALAQHGSIMSASGKWYFRSKDNVDYLIPEGKDEHLLLRKADDGVYRPVVVKQEYRYKAKRKAMNEIRKRYEVFMTYTRNMLAIDGSVPKDYQQNEQLCRQIGMSSYNLLGSWGSAEDNRTKFLESVTLAQNNNDLGAMYLLATYCTIVFGGYNWQAQNYTCAPKVFDRRFNDLIKHVHYEEVFEAVEAEKGKAFIDRNAKFVG
jgi:hypothetical protein